MAGLKLPKKKKGLRRKRTERWQRYLENHEENIVRQKQWRKNRKMTYENMTNADHTDQFDSEEPSRNTSSPIMSYSPHTERVSPCQAESPQAASFEWNPHVQGVPNSKLTSYEADSPAAVIFERNLTTLLKMMVEVSRVFDIISTEFWQEINIKKTNNDIEIDDPQVFHLDSWTSVSEGTLVHGKNFERYQDFLDQLLATGTYDALRPMCDSLPYNVNRYPCRFEEFNLLTFQSRFILTILHMLGWHAICAYEEISVPGDGVQSKNRERLLTVEQVFKVYVHSSIAWLGKHPFQGFEDFCDYLAGMASDGWLTLHALEGEEDRLIFIQGGNDRTPGKGGCFVDVYVNEAKGTFGKQLAMFASMGISPWDMLFD